MRKVPKIAIQGIKLSTVIGMLCTFILLSSTAIGSWVGYNNDRKALEMQTLTLNEYQAGELARVAGTAVSSIQGSLRQLAAVLSSGDLSPDTIQKDLELFGDSSRFFNSVVVIGPDAVVDYNVPYDLGLVGTKIKTPEVLNLLSAKIPLLTPPYNGPTGRYLFTASQPLFSRDGTYKGIIVGSIYLKEANRLREILGTQNQKADGSYFYVIDNDGRYLYHPNEKLIGLRANECPDISVFASGGTGSKRTSQQNGERYLAGYAPISQTGWSVIFQTPTENVNAFARQSILDTTVYLIPSVLLSLLLVFFISNRLSRPLHALARYTDNMANRKEQDVKLEGGRWNYEAVMLKKAILLAETNTRQTEADLLKEANHDPLTGLLNRRTLEHMTEEWMRQRRTFAVVFVDVDRFKPINDTYGHQQGDEVLKRLGAILNEQVGVHGHCFRYGGEEFVLLLSDLRENEAFAVAERIRVVVGTAPMPIPQTVTVSLGLAAYRGEESAKDLFHQADLALYQAKNAGRDRTVIAEAK
ncbi:sensor domain-containing diguanylate cyclase [Saccharibacillus sp. O23]|uniref:sensor domain-containing diguanylate cyclase n=1 Tax=Saccharibacillus sp. O23 TaxID=2009338 RepID=UPI0015C5D917|nr:sensor domain-containing diguanylate cyclase [Saccharibacillus sp. O23]